MSEMNEFLTATEAAKILDVSDATVRNRIADGTLKANKRGREWRIPRDEIERFKVLMNEDGNWESPKTPKAPNETNEETESTERNEIPQDWEVEILQVKLEAAERENLRLHNEVETLRQQVLDQSQSIRSLTEQNERLTILLANEQAQRMKALPRPLGWIGKLFGKHSNT